MKKVIVLSLTVLALISCGGGNSKNSDEYFNLEPTEVVEVQKTEICPNCNGSGYIPCMNCGGIIPMFDPYYGLYQEVTCGTCGGQGVVTCPVCNGSKYIKRSSYKPAFKGGSTVIFVKTNYGCDKCGCSGYHGLKHANNTYEGPCQNTDGWGHKCGHSPEHHGLRKW